MPLGATTPFGLRDVKLWLLDASGARSGTGVDLPVSRTFSFTDQEDFETLEGDDVTAASHGKGATVAWELEGGGISLDIWKVLSGATLVSSGSTPAQIKKITKKNTDARPYFDVEGQAISDSGGDFHTIVYRCKADGDLEANLENGSFLLTHCTGTGFGKTSTGDLYEFDQNETVTAITP